MLTEAPPAPEDSIFRCPETGEELEKTPAGFRAPSGKLWPIERGIPRFVADDKYVGSFSFEWNTHPQTQLDSANDSRVRSEQTLRDKTGLSPEDVSGKLVLDAGVGAGRYSEVLARWNGRVIGVDLSFAVEASHQNLSKYPNVRIAQADIFKLPFAPETFDLIVSIGVLHHTPDTEQAFRSLVPLLKPGGTICIWVYPHAGDYAMRNHWIPFTRNIPNAPFYRFCRRFVRLTQRFPESPLTRYLGGVFPVSAQTFGQENDILDTFDSYSPYFHGTHTPEEVEGWFRDAGLIEVARQPGWETAVRGRKPL